jgi:opacity protein-like surface antigen
MKHTNLTFTGSIQNLIFRLTQFSILVVAFIAITGTYTSAQVNFKLGGGIGVMSPVSDYGGTTMDFYNGTAYGLKGGLNLQAKAKIGFSSLNLTGEIDYSSLSNSGNSQPGQGSVNISQKVLSLKIGPEFRFNLPTITPYIGFNLALNSFSGETSFQGVSKVPSATYSMNNTTRFGIGFTAGTEVSLSPSLSLDFNISYNLLNLAGKEWVDVNPDARVNSYLSLNDQRDPLYSVGDDKHIISNSRSIQSILFTASVLFGL